MKGIGKQKKKDMRKMRKMNFKVCHENQTNILFSNKKLLEIHRFDFPDVGGNTAPSTPF